MNRIKLNRDRINNSKKYSEINKKVVEKSDLIENAKFFKGNKEIYTFKKGEPFKAIIKLNRKVKDLKLKFKQTGLAFLFKEVKNASPLKISSKSIGESEFVFETNSLFLSPSEYKLSLVGSESTLEKGLKLNVLEEGEKEIPDSSVFVEKNNPNSHFPNGDFLLIKPGGRNLPESPVNIISDRMILEEIEKASMFKNGKFNKTVRGEDKWELLLEEDR